MKNKSLIIKLSITFCVVTTLTISSCAQDKNKLKETIQKDQIQSGVTQKIRISVDGMVCTACQSTVKKTITSLNGIKDVEVSLKNKTAFINYYPALIKPEIIQKAVNDKGYTAGKPQEIKQ